MEDSNNNVAQEAGSSAGPIIGGIIILAVIVFGVLYFMGERNESAVNEDQMNSINTQSQSDMEADIEADLNSTDVDNLDYDLNEENFNAS